MIIIRELSRTDDFADLISLSRDFFAEYEAHHPDFFKIDELREEQVTGYFSAFCDQPTRKAYLALDGTQIVGYITIYVKDQPGYWLVKRVGEISGLMVHEDFRRQGIGEKLLELAKSFFMTQGVRYFTVYTAAANKRALDFYRKQGFVPLYTTLLGETTPGTLP